MLIKTAIHKASGDKIHFMHYTKGNYENVLNWYEREAKNKAAYGRDEIIGGEGFSYYTQDGNREFINNDWHLVRYSQSNYGAVSPRDFKEWFEVTKGAEL